MSAKAKLDEFDRTWSYHQNWLAGSEKDSPGEYLTTDSGDRGAFKLQFPYLPSHLTRNLPKSFLESLIRDLVERQHTIARRELVEAAIAEAEETLKELRGG